MERKLTGGVRMKKLLQSGKVDRGYLYIDAYNQTMNTISGTILTRISESNNYFVSVPIKKSNMIQKKNGMNIIICDGCGKKHRSGDLFDMLSDKWVAVVINKTMEGNYHFCPECHRVKKDGTLDIYTKDRR